jgi:signal transduction histidine kinase
MDEVSNAVLEAERQHAARLGILLELRLAVTKLNNEARQRHELESRGQLKAPFAFPLTTAREDVQRLLREADQLPAAEGQEWRQFRSDLGTFVEVTQDLRRFGLEGRSKFEVVDSKLDYFLGKARDRQDEIIVQNSELEDKAARTIKRWTVFALLVGALVAGATIWEVQRWFRRMRSSMSEAGRERAFTNQLLQGMVSAVAAVDENDRIRSANVAFFNIFPEASIGASILEKLGDDNAMKMLEAATTTRVNAATYRGRWLCHVKSDSAAKSFDVYSSPLAINGDHGQILTFVDVTEAAEAERVLRRSESLAAVGRATTQVAHEIRNPLGSIRLGVSMLRDSVNDNEALRTIELVERGIKHLNKLVVDVTQFSRQKALERSEVDLHELLERSLDLVADRIADKKTPVEKEFIDRRILGHWDADQLRQIFVNLLANAIDASPEKAPVKIVTELTGSEGNGGRSYAKVSFVDQGAGMDQTTLDRIFEPFFSTKKRGTGLGLAIVKQIVEQHGGHIDVKSEPGKGSRFILELPL